MVKRSSNGICPMAFPNRTSEVSERQRNDVALTSFANRIGFTSNIFPASPLNVVSTVRRAAASRTSVRVIEPEYFN
ncbi:MAG: hypothetical protein DMG14_30685 [Acidobacteria bacterium]|nr:MAG: hypothetical protein DMG14_30685 [Acidobacteriota bacterium]